MTQTSDAIEARTASQTTIVLDGTEVPFCDGETLYEISRRHRKEVPTLCYDDRLDAFGACRLCVVEVDGFRNPVASCTTKATPGMVVRSTSETLERHRKTLMELVVSENTGGSARNGNIDVDPLRGLKSQELSNLATRYEVDGTRFAGATSGKSRQDDGNPFILRDYDKCISCYRCVRVCAEREGDYAISVMNRGFHTQITTEFDSKLEDSACTFCGQCVQTCPTGALADRKALRDAETPGELKKTRTVCPYCGVGCSVDMLSKGDKIVGIHPAMDGPANQGALCIKGQYAFDFIQHPDRLQTPMIRASNGQLVPATWDEALDRAAAGFLAANRDHGRHSIYAIASGRAPHESAYSVQKFIRAGFASNHVDNCSRA
ncbi:MAG: (2Fe-2S)-binding protein [Planctomycetes bacterium]|nr:(2Fe-2S)-binding protein [Planctomycetota bacterium]